MEYNAKKYIHWVTTLSLTIRLAVVASQSAKSREILWKFELIQFKVIQGHRSWWQSKVHIMQLPL